MDVSRLGEEVLLKKLILISGAQGMGKSTLALELLENLRSRGVPVSLVKCEKENITPFSDLLSAISGIIGEGVEAIVRPSRVVGYVVMDTGGLLVSSSFRRMESLDSDIFASMLTAMRNFMADTMDMLGLSSEGSSTQVMSSLGYTIVVSVMEGGYLAVVLDGQASMAVLTYVKRLSKDLSQRFGSMVRNWDGFEDRVLPLQAYLDEEMNRDLIFYPERGEIIDALSRSALSTEASVLIFDDAHWIDPSSLDILASMSEWGLEGVHVVLLFDPERAKNHQSFQALVEMSADAVEVLAPWGREEIREFLVGRYGEHGWIDELSGEIYDRTLGHVALVVELISHLEEYGVLRRFGDSYLLDRKALSNLGGVASLPDIWRDKVERMPSDTKRILRALSVYGDTIPLEVASRILRIDEMDLMLSLDSAMDSGIIEVDDAIRFRNPGLRRALYDSLNPTQRRIYHRAIATVMAEGNAPPAQVAYHFWKASEVKAVGFLREAVKNAEAVQSYQEMHKYCKMALDLTKGRERFHFLVKGARAGSILGYMDEAFSLLEEAEELAENPEEYLEVFRVKSSVYFRRGLYSKVVEEAERYREMVSEDGVRYVELELARAMWRLGRIKEAESYLRDVMSGQVDGWLAMEVYRLYGILMTSLHRSEEAERYYVKSMEIAEEIGDLHGMSAASNNLAIIYVNRGDLEMAERYYLKALDYDAKLGDLRGRSLVMINLGELRITKGDLDGAKRLFEDIVEIKRAIGDLEGLGFALHGLADCQFLMGDYANALETVGAARDIFEEIGFREGVGFTGTLIAETLFSLHRRDEAEMEVKRSMRVFESLGDEISVEGVRYRQIEFEIKSGKNRDIPEPEHRENEEVYRHLLALKHSMSDNLDDAIKNLKICSALAEESRNFLRIHFYQAAISLLRGEESGEMEVLEERHARHYLNELSYFSLGRGNSPG